MEPKPASPLPWTYCGCAGHKHIGVGSRKAGTWLACVGLRDANGHRVDDSDPYVVAACNAYPALRARVAALDAENARLREALTDMLSGWRYIRMTHGDLYGVGWDRCEKSASAALAPKEPHEQGT